MKRLELLQTNSEKDGQVRLASKVAEEKRKLEKSLVDARFNFETAEKEIETALADSSLSVDAGFVKIQTAKLMELVLEIEGLEYFLDEFYAD